MSDLSPLLALGIGLMALVSLALTIFWVLMLVHVATNKNENQLMWVLIIIFTGIVGALIYYFVVIQKMNMLPSGSKNNSDHHNN